METVEKTGYDLMADILDINETVEKLKMRNTGETPDLDLCNATKLLLTYRDVCVNLLKQTVVVHGNVF